MIKVFKSAYPFVIVFLVLYAIILKLFLFIRPEHLQFDLDSPLSKSVDYFISTFPLNKLFAQNILAVLLVVFQAVMFNRIVNEYKMIGEINYLPGLMYILCSSAFREFSSLSQPLIANTFFILILRLLFATYKEDKCQQKLFDIGFWIGVASLFYFPSLAMILFVFMSLNIMRHLRIKEWIAVLVGVGVPYFLLSAWYFWNDGLMDFLENHFIRQFENNSVNTELNIRMLGIGAPLLFLFGWALFVLRNNFYKKVVQLRKFILILIWMAVIGDFSFLIQPDWEFNHFVILIIPFAFFFSNLFSEIKNYWLSETIHLTLLLIILFFQYQNFL